MCSKEIKPAEYEPEWCISTYEKEAEKDEDASCKEEADYMGFEDYSDYLAFMAGLR